MSQILPLYWRRRGHQSRCDITTVAPPQASCGAREEKDTFVCCASQNLDSALRHPLLTKTAIKKPLMRRFCLKSTVISKVYKEILMPDF